MWGGGLLRTNLVYLNLWFVGVALVQPLVPLTSVDPPRVVFSPLLVDDLDLTPTRLVRSVVGHSALQHSAGQ